MFYSHASKIFINIKETISSPIPGWATSIPILFQKALQQKFYNTLILKVQNTKYVNKTNPQ